MACLEGDHAFAGTSLRGASLAPHVMMVKRVKPHAVLLEVPKDGSVPDVLPWQSLRKCSFAAPHFHDDELPLPAVDDRGLATTRHTSHKEEAETEAAEEPAEESVVRERSKEAQVRVLERGHRHGVQYEAVHDLRSETVVRTLPRHQSRLGRSRAFVLP